MQSLWMLLACAMFAIMGACVKIAADLGASLPEIVLFRGIPSVLLLCSWALATRRQLRPRSWRPHIWRNLSGIASMWLGFFALAHLPLPTAISLNYTAPLFIAGWMLGWGGSQRDPVRILAVLAGFLGVLGVLRPSIEREQWLAALMGLGAGGLAAVAMMQIRQLGRLGEAEWRTVLLFSAGVCASGLAGQGVLGWRWLDLPTVGALVALGCAGLVGQLAMTRAFGLGSTLLTAALQYTTIIFAALIGVVFWGDRPATLAWAGMALIIGSGLLSIWRTYTEGRILSGAGSSPPKTAQEVR
ncbi:DMT family transporter [Castellaniella sp. S9]|uniref:DMT family transporter n=1 Tax=Castellaniella sp. S9 TaxID=2993652 RepID=UPI0022B57F2C|nr:DMT family transporter [Castellaniella sp. S9]